MTYTRTWDETTPLGSTAAADLDLDIQQFKTDIRERLAGILGLTLLQFTADPIVPLALALSTSLTMGSSAAAAGLIRAPNNQTIVAARNAAGLGDLVVLKANASDIIEFAAGKLTVNPSTGAAVFSGALTIGGLTDISGAGAGQIKFPATQNPSADPNTIDDYEEGTWTPVRNGFTEVLGGGSITTSGTYTKVGNLVYITAIIACTGGATIASTGFSSYLSGLPFMSVVDAICCWLNASTALSGGFAYVSISNLRVVTSWVATSATFEFSATYTV